MRAYAKPSKIAFSTWSVLKSVFRGAEVYNSFLASRRLAQRDG